MFDNKEFVEWLDQRAEEVAKKINQNEDLSFEEIMIGVLKSEEIYYRKRIAPRNAETAPEDGKTLGNP